MVIGEADQARDAGPIAAASLSRRPAAERTQQASRERQAVSD